MTKKLREKMEALVEKAIEGWQHGEDLYRSDYAGSPEEIDWVEDLIADTNQYLVDKGVE